MNSPLKFGPLLELVEVDSTQKVAQTLLSSDYNPPGIVFAHHQVAGRGRFDRKWVSEPGNSMTASFLFLGQPDHPAPYVLAMGLALAAAKAIGCNVTWPNDLYHEGKKIGGVLAEVFPCRAAKRITVVGCGVNLRGKPFGNELEHRATTLEQAGFDVSDALSLVHRIELELSQLPELSSWADLESLWLPYDATPGKLYKLADGTTVVASGVGPDGELETEGGLRVLAADGWFGSERPD